MKNVLKSPAFNQTAKRVENKRGDETGATVLEPSIVSTKLAKTDLDIARERIKELQSENVALVEELESYRSELEDLVEEKAAKLSKEKVEILEEKMNDQLEEASLEILLIEKKLESILESENLRFDAEVTAFSYEVICHLFKSFREENFNNFIRSVVNKYKKTYSNTEPVLIVSNSMVGPLQNMFDDVSFEGNSEVTNGCMVKIAGEIIDYRFESILAKLKDNLLESYIKHYG